MEGTLTATTTVLFFSKPLHFSTSAPPPQIRRTQLPLLRITTTASPQRNAVAAVSPVSAGGVDDASPSSSDVIVLDVRILETNTSIVGNGQLNFCSVYVAFDFLDLPGMMCDGCASSVKRILENQSQVSSASVDHTTGSAIVYPVSEAKVTPNWQKVIGEEIAKNLTNCGFDSNVRGEAAT